MTEAVANLLEQALRLPNDSRAWLAEAILESTTPPRSFIEEQLSKVHDRMEAVSSGRSQLVSAEKAHQTVREALEQRMAS